MYWAHVHRADTTVMARLRQTQIHHGLTMTTWRKGKEKATREKKKIVIVILCMLIYVNITETMYTVLLKALYPCIRGDSGTGNRWPAAHSRGCQGRGRAQTGIHWDPLHSVLQRILAGRSTCNGPHRPHTVLHSDSGVPKSRAWGRSHPRSLHTEVLYGRDQTDITACTSMKCSKAPSLIHGSISFFHTFKFKATLKMLKRLFCLMLHDITT